jgi:hypothetical protein
VLAGPAPATAGGGCGATCFKGLFTFGITIATYDVTADAFRGVGILDDQVRYGKFTRCKT